MSTAKIEITDANDSRAAFRYPAFTIFQTARCLVVLALEMQAVAVGWQVYEITKRPLDLGLVGLAQFLPGIVLFLVAGHVADVFDRRKVLIACEAGFGICFLLLLLLTGYRIQSVAPIYVVLVLLGIVRSFNGPASRSILPHLVPEEHFQNSVAWASGIFQIATILGPVLGGLIYAIFRGPFAVYLIAVVIAAVAVGLLLKLKVNSKSREKVETSTSSVFEGFRYIWREKLILGAISLDLFAVLLGGAVALLPVYAKEILNTGPWGLGILRSAPGIGAGIMAVVIAYKPLRKNVGATMLWCVAAFGLFTVLFGISRSMVFSIIALFIVGATDMVSVIVRGTLIQVATPDEMRGRVNAVDMIFIGASNELGQFESGVTAQWFGTVPAVILGGIGAIVVTGLWAWMFPALRKVNQLSFREEED
ncbi:MAG TPA: MFS transporter [Candidatus Sulfotelmatobacter sp.]|nr:MFS transporter [Candidatus Sulfotelmatobacter sp.]